MKNPFVGLRPFQEAESHLFFGRDREIKVLLNLILTLPVLIVYARSGTGKSSVLNAGVGPELVTEGTSVPIFIGTDVSDVVASVGRVLTESGWIFKGNGSLRDMLHQYWLETDKRTIVVLDQFEERLNSGMNHAELYTSIAHLANENSDAACIVISIREDYLGALEPLMRRVPNLLAASYRVPPLSREALEKAIYGPLSIGENPQADKALAAATIDDLHQRDGQAHLPGEQAFEPGYFQIVWSTLWEKGQQEDRARLTLNMYKGLGGASSILRRFTTERLGALEPAEAQLFWAMSRYLVLPTGAKVALTVDDITLLLNKSDFLSVPESSYTMEPVWVSDLPRDRLEALARQLLRTLTSSSTPLFQRVMRDGREEFELLHDLLASILLQWRSDFKQKFEAYCRSGSSRLRKRAKDMSRESWDSYARGSELTAVKAESREPTEYDIRRLTGAGDNIIPTSIRASEAERLAVLEQIIKETQSRLAEYTRRLAMIETISVTEEELQELVREGQDLLAADGIVNSSDWGYSQAISAAKARTNVERTQSEVIGRMLTLALDHFSPAVRRTFQEQLYFWSNRLRGMPLSRKLKPGAGAALMIGSIAIAILPACVPLLVGNWAVLSLLSSFRLQYTWLSVGIVSLAAIVLYAVAVYANREPSNLRENYEQVPWAKALPNTFFPPFASDSRTAYSSGLEGRWRILGWWPLPALTCLIIGVLGALLFHVLDFSATAGFNVGLLIGGPVGGVMLMLSQDL